VVKTVLVTGSAGHLGEALMRTLPQEGHSPIGLDIKASPFTQFVGSIANRSFVRSCLRTSRFFPEADDSKETRNSYEDDNAKVNEFLYRRADIEDIVSAHVLALQRARSIAFGRYIVSATTPFTRGDLQELHTQAAAVVRRYAPRYGDIYAARGWKIFPAIDRVYINERARADLGWQPRFDFAAVLTRLANGDDFRSPLARAIGSKGYHDVAFEDGPYPT
jgi:UDP-glucose 4-epimerase